MELHYRGIGGAVSKDIEKRRGGNGEVGNRKGGSDRGGRCFRQNSELEMQLGKTSRKEENEGSTRRGG